MGEIHPYGDLKAHGAGLFTLDGRWKKSPFPRRMTIVRHTSGALAIHSAIRLHDADYARIVDPLGRVDLILVPNSLHSDEARYYAERYPRATVLVPAAARAKCAAKLPRVDGAYDAWPSAWADELEALQVEGTRMSEALFWHRPSRTLITTDLVFHFVDELSGFSRALMKWNGAVQTVGPTRIFRWFFLRDRAAFARSLQPLKSWDFERIVMSHGTIVDQDGKRRFLAGYASLGV